MFVCLSVTVCMCVCHLLTQTRLNLLGCTLYRWIRLGEASDKNFDRKRTVGLGQISCISRISTRVNEELVKMIWFFIEQQKMKARMLKRVKKVFKVVHKKHFFQYFKGFYSLQWFYLKVFSMWFPDCLIIIVSWISIYASF